MMFKISACKWLALLGLVAFSGGCAAQPEAPSSPPQTQTVSTTQPQGIVIDGSSTVYPLTDEAAKEFQFGQTQKTPITVNFSGTSGGFKKFCAGETDISNASRPINSKELEACQKAGIKFIELPIAYDALTVVINPKNNWAEDITVEELRKLWEPAAEGKITRWNQIRPSWPDRPIKLYGAGQDSGTFDYFTEAIVGKARASRTDYIASEDDLALVRGVKDNPEALGYFGFAYYRENRTTLKSLAIDSGKGPVKPSEDAVREAKYQPLARPLFIYISARSAETKPELRQFVEFYVTNAPVLAKTVGYVALPESAYPIVLSHFKNNRIGTVFGGQTQTKLTIEELMRKEAKL